MLAGSYRPYSVIGDAFIELGRHDAAFASFASFERMISLRPSLASYARIAYARELSGDRAGAPPWLRRGKCQESARDARLVWKSVCDESRVLGSLGAGRASSPGPPVAGPRRIIDA